LAARESLKAYLLLAVAALTCPCHLPLLLAILAGTALAGALREHFVVAFVVLAIVFIVSLFFGLRIWRQALDRKEADA
jgi:mercuric ion transport protein